MWRFASGPNDRPGYSETVKIAVYQAPLLAAGSLEVVSLIQERVAWCESQGVSMLCCPEAILGGLADYDENPARFAIRTDNGHLDRVLAPLTSNTVTLIVGFTEVAPDKRLYNAAAVFHQGRVAGLYRKIHPAIRQSVYSVGSETPVFRVGELTFGIVICNDSNYALSGAMAAQGARVVFVPTNNGLPNKRAYSELVRETRNADIAGAIQTGVWVIRADVAGRNGKLTSYGSSGIVDPTGSIVREARPESADTLVVDIEIPRRVPTRFGIGTYGAATLTE